MNDYINRYNNESAIKKEEFDVNELKYRTNYSHRNSENKAQNHNKYINIKDGDIQLFHKFKNKQMTTKNADQKIKRKINKKDNKISINNRFNKTNQLSNRLNLNDLNNERNINMNSYINRNKPIRLNYDKKNQYDEIFQQINKNYNDDIKYDNEYNSSLNNNFENIQYKIENLKNHFNFKGNNEEFIKYLEIVKMKSDLINLIEILFNNGENLNEENAEDCFYRLNSFVDFKNKEEKSLLNGYHYLLEKLFEINNLNKNNNMNEI